MAQFLAVQAITNDQLVKMYKQLLHEDELSIYVVGDVNVNEMKQKFEKHFQFTDRQIIPTS